jgi:F-type H+-transporting ATPase subunit a
VNLEKFPTFAQNLTVYRSNITKMAMNNRLKTFILSIAAVLYVSISFASEHSHDAHADGAEHHEEAGHEEHAKKEFNVNDMIMHHIMDAHEYHLWGPEHGGTSIYLPIILIDNGFKTFSSSEFYHGEVVNTKDDKGKDVHYLVGTGAAAGYAMVHEKIYKLENGVIHFEDGHAHNAKPFDLSITRNVIALFLTLITVFILMFGTAKYYRKNGAVGPRGVAKFTEPIILFVRDDIAKACIGEKNHKKYVPFLLTIFFFIWVSNMLGLIPVLSSNLTGNITITLFLAVCTLLVTVFSGNKNYWGHIFATPGVPKALLPIMIPIEIVGIFTKPFALMIRLFANITAGHIIILALVSIIFINQNAAWGALSVPMALFISVLELLVAFLQAYLFAMLSALFIGAAVEDAHH